MISQNHCFSNVTKIMCNAKWWVFACVYVCVCVFCMSVRVALTPSLIVLSFPLPLYINCIL